MYARERMRTIWFLYSKLLEAQEKGNFKEFCHYFDAIIPLARSVTQALQKEFKHKEDFKEWYSNIQEIMDKDQLFRFFNNERNLILKEGRQSEKEIKYQITAFCPSEYEKPKIVLTRTDDKINGRLVEANSYDRDIPGKVIIRYLYYLKNKPEQQAVVLLHKYLIEIEMILIDFKKTVL